MKTANIITEFGDIKVYCYIDNKLDKVVNLPTMQSAIEYMGNYIRSND